jgi:hypothetical protein
MNAATLKRLKALEARAPEPDDDGEACKARLIARMNQIRERLRAQLDWTEPTEAERAQVYSNLEAMFPGIGARMAAARASDVPAAA